MSRHLEEAFESLMSEQEEVQELFRTVARQLAGDVGAEDALYAEWSSLCQVS